MNKITLLLMIFAFTFSYAQESVYFDDFTDDTYPGWVFYDVDGDGNNWGDLNQIEDGDGNAVTPPSLISRSWQGSPLTPDNWAVSPAIDLSTASGTITIDYITQVAAQTWDEETYSVYVSTSSDLAVLQNETPVFSTTLGDGAGTNPEETHSHDISGFAGEDEVYIAFRHYNTTDMDFIAIHEVEVLSETLSNNQFVAENNFVQFVKDNTLNLQASTLLNNVEIFNLAGKRVIQNNLNAQNDVQVDISSLNTGIYIAKLASENGVHTFKFAK